MERIADEIGKTPAVEGVGNPMMLSVSVGGAYVDGSSEVSSEAVIAAADRSLYQAKATGRGRAGVPLPVELGVTS